MNSALELSERAEVEFYEALGERVRSARRQQHLSQEALARRVGLTRSSVANLESARQHPPIYVLTLLARALDVTEADLLPPSHQRAGLNTDRLEQQLRQYGEQQQHMIRATARAAGLTLADA